MLSFEDGNPLARTLKAIMVLPTLPLSDVARSLWWHRRELMAACQLEGLIGLDMCIQLIILIATTSKATYMRFFDKKQLTMVQLEVTPV
jgi:hypothetical protein